MLERDEAGRIVSRTVDGATTSFTYDAAGQLTGATGPDGRRSYSWDALGRMTRRSEADATTSFTYDAAGQLTGATGPDGAVAFSYDELGRRTDERGPGGRRRLVWDTSGFVAFLLFAQPLNLYPSRTGTSVGNLLFILHGIV